MYGIIGNGETCAFISIFSSLDWLCVPRFDSPTIFAGLLDDQKGGRFRIAPASASDDTNSRGQRRRTREDALRTRGWDFSNCLRAFLSAKVWMASSGGRPVICPASKRIVLEKLVLDNEICGMALRMVRGIEARGDRLAGDLYGDIYAGDHFLTSEETLRYWSWFHRRASATVPATRRRAASCGAGRMSGRSACTIEFLSE